MADIKSNGHSADIKGNGHSAPQAKNPVMGKYLVPGERLTPESLAGYYNRNVEEAREHFNANDWEDPSQMYAQFDFLIEHVDLNGKTLLDVGAGNGLFFEFLAERGIKPKQMTAIDLAEGGVEIIRQRFPEVDAIKGDFFEHEFEESFDVITMFGVAPCLKFIFPEKDRLSSLLLLLDRAVRYSNYGVAMSFLNRNCYETCEKENYEYVYYYPEEICTMLSGGRFDISTVHNDLVTTCFAYSHDANGLPFRFNLNRIERVMHLLR